MITTLLLAALTTGPTALPDSSTDWLLVRSRDEQVGPLQWEQIGNLYLRGLDWELVEESAGAARPQTSRMVIGSPSDHSLVADLAATFQVTFQGEVMYFRGVAQPAGTGFVTYDTDPDGSGILFLTCGATDEGVLANFQTPLSIKFGQYLLTRQGTQIETGQNARHFDLTRPHVVRLDLDYDRLLEGASANQDERALRLARGLVGYAHVFAALGATDLLPYAEQLLAQRDAIAHARSVFEGRDHTARALAAYATCKQALQLEPETAPVFYVVYGLPEASNAKNFGVDAVTKRRQILFNLTALSEAAHYDAVLIHETVHSFQTLSGQRLLDRAIDEGVATAIAQLLAPDLTDADALLWSEAELASAETYRSELIEAFRRDAEATDEETLKHWLVLDLTPPGLPKAPSRAAYYVGWLAAHAWLADDPTRGPADLIRATPETLLAALKPE